MGRSKLKMEMISNQKSRNLTFKKRKDGLIKKLHEFTTLCDVDACMIIYNGPVQEQKDHATAVEQQDYIWPQNRDEVRRIIDLYKARKQGNYNNKTCGLSDFFQERKRKAEEQLLKLKKNNMEAKYPVWDDFFNFLTESQLRQFGVGLNSKVESVKSRIELLKTSVKSRIFTHQQYGYPPPGQFYPPPPPYDDLYGYMPLPPYQQYLSPYSDDSSTRRNDTKKEDDGPIGGSKKSTVAIICLAIVAVAVLSFFLFKCWQKKKREEQYARLLKLFEEDDELELELGLRD
ncbi:hypothetical protein DH2020_024126 [Rehmannia glutinosa]|uniref:MADS-box domain-containing protein n=1 Tax=Rehmannia glutinosa TaxID=99300 RepID=A0ABR0WA97_REHGL